MIRISFSSGQFLSSASFPWIMSGQHKEVQLIPGTIQSGMTIRAIHPVLLGNAVECNFLLSPSKFYPRFVEHYAKKFVTFILLERRVNKIDPEN